MKYHLMYKDFDPQVVAYTKVLLRGWSNLTEEEKATEMRTWLWFVAEVDKIPVPELRIDPRWGSGLYDRRRNRILMGKTSIITLLHEYRHAMQDRVAIDYSPFDGTDDPWEGDARAWSLSLYHKVAPKTLKRLVGNGQVLHLTIDDFAST